MISLQDQVEEGAWFFHKNCLKCCYCYSPYEEGFQRMPTGEYTCSRCYQQYICPVCRSIIYRYQKARMEGRFFYHDHCYLQVVSTNAHLTSQCIMYNSLSPCVVCSQSTCYLHRTDTVPPDDNGYSYDQCLCGDSDWCWSCCLCM